MLMDANDRAVDEHFLEIGIPRQHGKHPLPHATFLPPCKALIDAVPEAELLRKVSPRGARARHPQHGLDEQAIVRRNTPAIARQQACNPFPLIVAEVQTRRWFALSADWANYIMFNVNTT